MPEVRVIIPEDLDRALDALIKAGFAGNKAELARAALTHFLSTIPTQLPKGYDLENAFSPDGRVFQLEYARESIKKSGTIVGVCCQEGIVLTKKLRSDDSLSVLPNPFVRIFNVHERIGLTYGGILTDAYIVVEEALKQAKTLEKEGLLDVETLAKRLTLFMQPYGQRKDMRPLAVALIIGGLDIQNNPRLFLLHSAGFTQELKACAIGIDEDKAKEMLKERYREDLSLKEAVDLATKATLIEEEKRDRILIATIDVKTKKFKEITS